jgi:methionyl-tRNA synthetase
MQVDMGSYGKRQILAGLAEAFTPEQLIGTKAVFVANLPPRKMMGAESQGMMLVAKHEDMYSLVRVDEGMAPGARLC